MSTNWEQHFRQMVPRKTSLVMVTKDCYVGFGTDVPPEDIQFGEETDIITGTITSKILLNDNMKAIKSFFDDAKAVTPQAASIKDKFLKWYDSLWWFSQSDYDLARNQRNSFNLANTVAIEEKKAVEEVMKTGLSTEEMQNEPDRRLESGMLPGPTKPPIKIPTVVWIVVGMTAGVIVLFLLLQVSSKVARVAVPML